MNFIALFIGHIAQASGRVAPYLFYGFISLLAYLLMVSIFAFFHFILGHEFNLIELWVQENIWVIITISKLLSLFLIYQYYRAQNFGSSPLGYYFARPFQYPPRRFYVALAFLLLFFLVELKPEFNEDYSLLAMGIHLIGHTVYFASDFLVVSYLMRRDPPSSKGDLALTLFLACAVFGVLAYTVSPSKHHFSFYLIFEFFLMLFFYGSKNSWIASAWVLLLLNNILGVFFSLDIFYEEDVGIFRCNGELGGLQMVVAFALCLLYWSRGRGAESRSI